MRNLQLKPGYNVQIAVESEYVAGVEIFHFFAYKERTCCKTICKNSFASRSYQIICFITGPLILRINKLVIIDSIQYRIKEFSGQVFCHSKVHVQEVAAVSCSCARHFAFKIPDEFIHFRDQRDNVSGLVITGQQKVKAGAAAHGPKVQNAGRKEFVVAQEGGSQMLNGVDFRRIHNRLKVRAGHADIKGGNDRVPRLILAGDIDAWKKF